jgi:hypothetical protein
MIIDDLDVIGVSLLPPEADTPLVVDPDTVLPGPVTLQFLKTVTRRDAQITQGVSGMQNNELPEHKALEIRRVSLYGNSAEEPLGVPVRETLDHAIILTHGVINARGYQSS